MNAKQLIDHVLKEVGNPDWVQPKFNIGDTVHVKGTSITGTITYYGSYDDHLGDYRVKVLDPKAGKPIFYNEKGLELVKKTESQMGEETAKYKAGSNQADSSYWYSGKN